MKFLWIGAMALLLAFPAKAASEGEFKAAYDAAEQAERQALTIHNAWTVTETMLKSAKQSGDSKDYAAGLAQAREAEALAKASIAQAEEQRAAWRGAVLH